MTLRMGLLTVAAWLLAVPAWAQEDAPTPEPTEEATEATPEPTPPPPPAVAPPTNVEAKDHPLDHGDQIDVTWTLSTDDDVTHYLLYRAQEPNGLWGAGVKFTHSKLWDGDTTMRVTSEKNEREEEYWFKVSAVSPKGESERVGPIGPVKATRQIFDGTPLENAQYPPGSRNGRFWLMIITLLVCGSVVLWIYWARSGKEVKVRKIAGLEAVDEAVGRATEMGRSVLFIPGIQDMNDIQTIAGITVLARVAKTAAEYDAKIEVPTSRALVMTTAKETVQAAFLGAGRPDAYNEDDIYYVTDEQFGYVAYLQGMMVREKPAACFYMGSFFAESLILAETGNSVGAIQVAGTAQPAQLPFFVAACDYTLIGEEFFAASAYLSGSAEELGSLKGQDVGKVVVAVGLVVGVFVATVVALSATEAGTFAKLLNFIKFTLLS